MEDEKNIDGFAPSPNNIEELENFKLIWLDKTFYYSDKGLSAKIWLRQITPYLKTFFDVTECFNYILNTEVDYIILIISIDSFDGTDILIKASEFIQITHLYAIASSHLSNNDSYPKNLRAVLTNEHDLLIKLTDDVRYCTQNTIKFNIFTSPTESGRSSTDLRRQSTKFMWFQYMLDILFNIPEPNKAKQELIEFCRSCYANDQTEQQKITDFELNYRSEEAIKWYTRDSFLFRLGNKVLRAEHIDSMYKLRYIFADLHTQLIELHCDYLQGLIDSESGPPILTVYRGQFMSIRELDQLKRSIGDYISMNTFLSTSTDRQVSLLFSGDGAQRPQFESILFEIDIQTDICVSPYADIREFSWNKDEEEILLALGTIFHIDSIVPNDNVWIVKLTLGNQCPDGIKCVRDFLPNLQGGNHQSAEDFAQCLFHMGDPNRAAQICERMITAKPSIGDLDTSILLNNLATYKIIGGDKDFNGMLQCYQFCVELIPRHLLPTFAPILVNAANLLTSRYHYKRAQKVLYATISMIEREVDATRDGEINQIKMIFRADVYMALAVIHGNQNQTREALNYFQSVLRIFQKHLPSGNPRFGSVYLNLAVIYFQDGKYYDAIEYGKKALSIYLECLPPGHPTIADCYQCLSTLYRHNGEIAEAWKLIDIAREQRLNAEPVDQIRLGLSYFNIGELWAATNDDTQAFNYYLKAEEQWRQRLPESDIRFGQLYAAIGSVYGYVEGDFIAACTYLEKALQIELNRSKTISQIGSIFLGHIYNTLGKNYHNRGKYTEALAYYEKSSSIYEHYLTPTHIDWFDHFSFLGLSHRELGNYIQALTYHQKALDIILVQECVALNKESIGNAYGNIAAVHLLNGSYREAISYFEKGISTKLEIMTCHSPAFIVIYSNLANAYLGINEYSTALKYLHQALDISKKIPEKYQETLASIYNTIGSIYKEQGKLDQALDYFQLSLEVKLNCLPPDHPSLVAPYNNLANTYALMLEYDRSVNNFENALAIFQKHENLSNPTLAQLNANIGLCYYQLGKWDKAEDCLQRSRTILRCFYDDENHFNFAYIYNSLALVKCVQGSFDEAERLCQKALDLRLTELPSDNIEVGLSFETFGIIYNAQMKYDDALNYFHKSEMIIQNINNEHPLLVRIFRATGSVFYNQAVYSKALEYYIKAMELALKIYTTNQKVIDGLNYAVDRVMDHVFN